MQIRNHAALQFEKALEDTTMYCVCVLTDNTWWDNPCALFALLQFEKALEDPGRRRAAAEAVRRYCTTTRHDFQEHVPSLLTARALLSLASWHVESSDSPPSTCSMHLVPTLPHCTHAEPALLPAAACVLSCALGGDPDEDHFACHAALQGSRALVPSPT
jgi:hypothetical protein